MKALNVAAAIALMGGRKPVNPIGQCFESAIRQACFAEYPEGAQVKLCHGIGVANLPGQEGCPMGHAWVEVIIPGQRVALDTTWGVRRLAADYRRDMKLEFVLEYTPAAALTLWRLHDMPGPWHRRIREITDAYSAARVTP